MTFAQLEADLKTKKTAIQALIAKTTATCQAHVVRPATATEPEVRGRLMTADEKAAIEAACAEGETIQARIDGLRDDAEIIARVNRLREPSGAAPSPGTGLAPRDARSLGAQFTQSAQYQNLLANRLHRGGSAWSSGAVEVFDHMRATTLTEDAASGGKLIAPQYLPGVQQLMFKRMVVADLIASGVTDSNAIIYMVETLFTNAAAPVLEGGVKPESALAFDQKTDSVSKIAHWLPVTEELLEDVAAMMSYIDARLRFGVQLAEEDQILNGNGTPPNLLGIMNRPGLATAVVRNAGATPPETNADAILRQISAIATTAFVYPDGIVLNPTNWFTIQTAKDTTANYYGGGPFSPLPTASIWGTPIAVTPSIVAGTALVGAFGSQAQVFRKGGIRVEASNSHQDFFIKNLVAIRAEERLALAVYRPGAFGKVTGLN